MRFTTLLKNLILEQTRFEVLFNKNTKPTTDKDGKKIKPKMKPEEFFALAKMDPTTKLSNVDLDTADESEYSKVKMGKYVDWLIRQYLNPEVDVNPDAPSYKEEVKRAKERIIQEDGEKIYNLLLKFIKYHKRIPEERRSIDKFTLKTLYNELKDYDISTATTTKAERRKAKIHPGAKLVFEGQKWVVIKIEGVSDLSCEAAQLYGGWMAGPSKGETEWCTSARSTSQCKRYLGMGPLFVMYDPNDTEVGELSGLPRERYQFHFEDNQFMDKYDHRVDVVQYLNGPMAELKEFFKPQFIKSLGRKGAGGEEIFNLTSFSDGIMGKYISIYGIQDIFDQLSPKIREIRIEPGENKHNIILNLPEDMGKFKNLTHLMLVNCIDKIPDSICECKELNFLSLYRNPNLKSVPECIADLPKLLFLNLNSTGVTVPEKIKKAGNEIEDNMFEFVNEPD